jgi:type I restriction enzyme, S subunit
VSGEVLPVLSEGWAWAKLGDLLAEPLVNGRSVPDSQAGFPVLRLTAIRQGRVDVSRCKTGDWTEQEALPFRVKCGDFLVARGNGSLSLVGRGGLVDSDPGAVAFPDTLIRVRTDQKVIAGRYLREVWHSELVRRQIEQAARTTAGIYKVNQQSMRAIVFSLPPLGEQHRIVAAIEARCSRLDAAVAALQRVQANLKRYRAAVLKAACEGRLVPSEEKALPAIPLGDLLAEPLSNGRSVPTSAEGFPVLWLTSLKGGGIDLGEFKIGAWTEREARPYLVSRGDFLVSRGNGSLSLVGKGGLVDREPRGVAYPDTLIRVRVDERRVLGEYLRLAWQSESLRRQIEASARTTAGIYKINQQTMRDYVIPLPPLAEQHRIVAEVERRLSVIQAVETAVTTNLLRAATLRQAILRRAFEGRLVPQDPNDEPAGVLLERIRAERAQAEAPVGRRAKGRRGLTLPLEM